MRSWQRSNACSASSSAGISASGGVTMNTRITRVGAVGIPRRRGGRRRSSAFVPRLPAQQRSCPGLQQRSCPGWGATAFVPRRSCDETTRQLGGEPRRTAFRNPRPGARPGVWRDYSRLRATTHGDSTAGGAGQAGRSGDAHCGEASPRDGSKYRATAEFAVVGLRPLAGS